MVFLTTGAGAEAGAGACDSTRDSKEKENFHSNHGSDPGKVVLDKLQVPR
jgi:hypothetical protein